MVAIGKKADTYSSGIDSFLEPAVSDIKKLEKGIALLPSKTVHGLIAFLGDNLASHPAGGFKEGFTALHPCRTCDAPLAMFRECVDVKKFVLRTEEAYQEQLQLLNAAPNQRVRLTLIIGIQKRNQRQQKFSCSILVPMETSGSQHLRCGSLP